MGSIGKSCKHKEDPENGHMNRLKLAKGSQG